MDDADPNAPFIIRIPNLLTPAECAALIDRIESLKPEVATINTTDGTQVKRDVRNNDRVIFDDPHLADELLQKAGKDAPRSIYGMNLVGANERFRCYRYQPGMRFAPHADGSFHRNQKERSCYSFLVYLNEEFSGGNTTFITDPEVVIEPRTGMGLLFQHPLIHEGGLVTGGIKYVARTDLMYRTDA